METLAVCSPNFKHSKSCIKFFETKISGQEVSFGFIKTIDPPKLGDGDEKMVIFKILAFSANYRDKSAILSFKDTCKEKMDQEAYYYYPFGSDFVCEVIMTGSGVPELRPGDRVICDGSYPFKIDGSFGGLPTNCASQRYQKLPYAYLKKISDTIPTEVAAAFTISGQTAYSIVRKLDPRKGQTILVTAGSSNTSLAVINALRKYDVDIFALSQRSDIKEKLIEQGVKEVYSLDDLLNPEIINVKFDAVVDPFYDLHLARTVRLIKNGGKYISCGMYQQNKYYDKISSPEDNLSAIFNHCIINNISLIGNCLGNSDDLQNALSDYESGVFNIVIDSVYKIQEAEKFVAKTFHNEPRFGKVVFSYV
ncbi:zinc-binding alcohol dehydrogenase family protein [Sphingobacterium thalpophilum]|uniref:Putative alcohol dehydrogenase n=1 Tax=Sphingobacterium thalpophilum TaxID=259 RepID=A0A4U9VTL8_9SPHI|nr:zinc-binding alcohol dehydrogenase family protein [Sphingobacterium thalpophilum]VTR49269.1 putative alcohol dehydrogenase [Sphingobacterium thalpophilum]